MTLQTSTEFVAFLCGALFAGAAVCIDGVPASSSLEAASSDPSPAGG